MANTKNLKPFKKGHDPRRNVKGRPPANSEELNALIDEIFAETLTNDKGRQSTKIRDAIERLLSHQNPAGVIHILDRRYGKVKQDVNLLNLNLSELTNEQLERIANGEDPLKVISNA
jgi:hypothetical protein